MKALLSFVFLLSMHALMAQELERIWSTDSVLKIPESVLFDGKNKVLYVSNIDGASDQKDSKGFIAKLGLDGSIINANWITGLNAPKGMGLYKNKLYVTDLTEVVVIDTKKGIITERIPVENSIFLNDLSIDEKGLVYVTDSRTGRVHTIENNQVLLLLEKLQSPNGILAVKDGLMILDRGSLLKMSFSNGQLSKIADGMDPGTDGIEMTTRKDYIVSCWGGVIYYVYANGNKKTLLDTRETKINSADIGFDPKSGIIYVPTFLSNSVVAYRLKQ